MSHWLENTVQRGQFGETLLASGVERLFHGWHSPADLVGKICTGAERWQRVIRQMQAPVNLAEILRSRVIL